MPGETDDMRLPLCRAEEAHVVVQSPPGRIEPMDVILASALVVALAEIGDKTMLLAVMLACRFRRPFPVVAGIIVATLANHGIAAFVGVEAAALLDSFWFRLVVALGFLGMAGWTLVPDKLDDGAAPRGSDRAGPFVTTLLCFFVVEIGDKTQIATVALAAHYHSVLLVAAGTTIGMLLVNVPAVFLGERITRAIPLVWIRRAAALLFAGLGVAALVALFG